MQLARSLFFPDERTEQTVSRKLKETLAAYQLNQHYSKNEILETYLNTTYFGNLAFGAEAAANRYFGKRAKDLTLPEAAMLAGLPQSPSSYDPLRNYDVAKRRQEHVLGLMKELEYITADEYEAAKAEPLQVGTPTPTPVQAAHWVNYIQDAIRERFGPDALFTSGLRAQTTIDLEVQRMAEQIVAANEPVRRQARANNTAMVVIDPRNGQVLAMVGSKNFNDRSIDGQVNVAVAGRQPGSSIKPLVYLAGFERGLNPAIEVLDRQIGFSAPPGQPAYVPANYEDKYYGRIALRDALGNSLNVPAVMVLKYVGVPYFQELARRMGITTLDSWDRHWLSLTLGGGEVKLVELVGAYATIARGGKYTPVEPFLRVENARGDVLHEAAPDGSGEQVIDPRVNYQILHTMGDPGSRLLTFGPNTPLSLPRPHMVKTGTTDDYRDTWTVGCLPQVCVGIWMGNTDNAQMVKVSSSLTAGKIWVEMMNAMIDRYQLEPVPFERPEGVIVTQVPNVGVARPGAPTHEEVFLPGAEQRFLLEIDWMRPDP
jgi:membrane peptidoglycan carboxypeptidase